MSLNPEGLRLYQQRLASMTTALGNLPQPIVRGRACALGTLTSMQRRIDELVLAWETRAMTELDRKDVGRNASTLRTLREDEWVYVDFGGVYFDLAEAGDRLEFCDAIAALESAQASAVS